MHQDKIHSVKIDFISTQMLANKLSLTPHWQRFMSRRFICYEGISFIPICSFMFDDHSFDFYIKVEPLSSGYTYLQKYYITKNILVFENKWTSITAFVFFLSRNQRLCFISEMKGILNNNNSSWGSWREGLYNTVLFKC